MPIQGNSRKLLNEKQCFDLWVELDAIEKVQSHLKLAGHVNPNTGHEFTIMAIWNAAMRWVLENIPEARKIYVRKGSTMSQEQWEEWLVEKAMYVLGNSSRSRFFKWVRRNGFEKYDYVYAERYGVEATHSRPLPA